MPSQGSQAGSQRPDRLVTPTLCGAEDRMLLFAAEADDDDTKEDMLRDFWKDEMANFEYTMTNATTGEPIEGAGAIVAPTFSRDKVLGAFENDCV